MDSGRIGNLIYKLRKEKNMTQRELADSLHLSDRTISKWERGMGCPDISLLQDLSAFLGVDIEVILGGTLPSNDFTGGNMKKNKYYVCPVCGNLVMSTGDAKISCCGRTLEPLTLQKAPECEKLKTELIENEWFITGDHPMTKEHYISFLAFATGGEVHVIKTYPEWDLQVRLFKRGRGMLIWYCTEHGLFYQLL